MSNDLREILDDPDASEQLYQLLRKNGRRSIIINFQGQNYTVRMAYREQRKEESASLVSKLRQLYCELGRKMQKLLQSLWQSRQQNAGQKEKKR